MGDKFEMHTAFSREGPEKVYVQHLLKQQGKLINELLEQKAYFYVCGDAANMAREVNTVLAQIIAEHRGKTEAKAEEIVKNMRAANQYQVRDTPHSTPPATLWLLTSMNRRMFGHRRMYSTSVWIWTWSIMKRANIRAELGASCLCALAVWDTGVLGWHACK